MEGGVRRDAERRRFPHPARSARHLPPGEGFKGLARCPAPTATNHPSSNKRTMSLVRVSAETLPGFSPVEISRGWGIPKGRISGRPFGSLFFPYSFRESEKNMAPGGNYKQKGPAGCPAPTYTHTTHWSRGGVSPPAGGHIGPPLRRWIERRGIARRDVRKICRKLPRSSLLGA